MTPVGKPKCIDYVIIYYITTLYDVYVYTVALELQVSYLSYLISWTQGQMQDLSRRGGSE